MLGSLAIDGEHIVGTVGLAIPEKSSAIVFPEPVDLAKLIAWSRNAVNLTVGEGRRDIPPA